MIKTLIYFICKLFKEIWRWKTTKKEKENSQNEITTFEQFKSQPITQSSNTLEAF